MTNPGNTAWAVAAFVLALAVAACSPVTHTTYEYAPPASAEGQQCTAQCAQTEQACNQSCELVYESCLAEERDAARWHYQYYVNDRKARHLPIERTMDDYNYDYRCLDKKPDKCQAACAGDQRTCYADCGGKVTGTSVCTGFCDQK